MRVTKEKAAENRERILAEASRLFREKGFDGVGVDAIMEAAGLTHGGFYRHFRSKEDLATEATARALARSGEKLAGCDRLGDYVDAYLSREHLVDRGDGCVMAALSCDIARQGAGVRGGLTAYLRGRLELLAGWFGGSRAARRRQAIATLSGVVGAMVLARAVDDPALADEILAAGREVFGRAKA